MNVEDIKSSAINVAAEIPEKEARSFKRLCQMLTNLSHKQIIDEYMSKLFPLEAVGKSNSNDSNLSVNKPTSIKVTSNKSNDTASKISLESLKAAIRNAENKAEDLNPKPSTSTKCENVINSAREISPFGLGACGSFRTPYGSRLSLNSTTSSGSKPDDSSVFSLQNLHTAIVDVENVAKNIIYSSTPKVLEDLIKPEYVSKVAKLEMNDILSRTQDRIRNEIEIFQNLSYYFHTIDSTAKIIPFGSATYGFGGQRTNFNILAVSGVKESNFVGILDRLDVHMFGAKESRKLAPDALLQKFENSFKLSSRLSSEFEILSKTMANGTTGSQLRILHKKWRIQCILHFEENTTIMTSSQIIHDYMQLSPICKCFSFFSGLFLKR